METLATFIQIVCGTTNATLHPLSGSEFGSITKNITDKKFVA